MIKLDDVVFSYDQRNTFRYSLEVKQTEKLWIHGPSGAGKSTLFKLLLGFVQPQSGEIFVAGERMNAHNAVRIRERMSFVPQHISLGRAKLWDILEEIFSFRANRHLEFNRNILLEYFYKFNLNPSLVDQSFDQVSGGEKQRVAIILALLLKRDILLLDESLSAIDQNQRKIVLQQLAELDQTVLLIAHDKPHDGAFHEVDFNSITMK